MKGLLSKLQSIWVLLSISGITLVLLAVGSAFGYLSEGIFFNLDWRGYLSFSTVPVILGFGFLLSSLSEEEKELHRKMWYLYLLLLLSGLVMYLIGIIAYNSLIDGSTQTAWGVEYVFYLLFGLAVTSLGAVLFVSATSSSREKIWKLRFLWILISITGFVLAIIGIVSYAITPDAASKNLLGIQWYEYLLFSGVPLVLGSVLVLGSRPDDGESLLWKLKYPGFLVFLVGFILLIFAPVVYFIDAQHVDPLLSVLCNDWFAFSLIPLGIGLAIIVVPASEDAQELYSKLKFIFLVLVLGGVLSYLIGVLSLADILALTDLTWDAWVLLGSVLIFTGIAFIYRISVNEEGGPSALSRPVIYKGPAAEVAAPSDKSIVSKMKLKPKEQLTYYRIAKNIALYSKEQYKAAKKDGDLSTAAYNTLIAKMDEAITKHDKRIKAIKKRSEKKDRKRLFEQELGISAAKPKVEPAKEKIPGLTTDKPVLEFHEPAKTTTVSPPPLQRPRVDLPSQSSAPPPLQKPKIIETSTSPPAVTPVTPRSSIPPPTPVTPPAPITSQPPSPVSGQPADVVGTARSTSIAELRGEMLKELRRLRDIFKDEE
ncbi:MAG: hypothetical protein ACTSRU_05780 [Candidatus Hodarchaeales archaeon]